MTINELLQTGLCDAIHNAQLIGVHPGADGYEKLIVEISGACYELNGGHQWSENRSGYDVGKFGYLVSASSFGDDSLPLWACHFRTYIDQSLRRVPELDLRELPANDVGRVLATIGWRCDAKPRGFRAPVGIIPGERGAFVPDETVAVTLRVPPEFVRECHYIQMEPATVLKSFVGDLVGMVNYAHCPRADGYSSNGSDERELADAWLQRAHGMRRIDLDAFDDAEDSATERRDAWIDLLDEFESIGGDPESLFAVVEASLTDQAKKKDK